MTLTQTKLTENANSGLVGFIRYINDKNHINHREAKEKGDIQRLERVKTLDKTLLEDGSSKNKGVSMILPIPTCYESIEEQKRFTNEFMNYFCKDLGIDKTSLAYEMVIHNHIKPNGVKNYHAHIVLVDRQLNTSKTKEVKGKKRYYKIVDGVKVRCSKNEDGSFFEYDKSKTELAKTFGKHFYLNKSFEKNGIKYFVRDFSSRSMPLLATEIEKRFIDTFDKAKIDLERSKKSLKNITDYSYLKIGKRITWKKGEKPNLKTLLKSNAQLFRIRYNNHLKEYNNKLHLINKRVKANQITYQQEDDFKHLALSDFKIAIQKDITELNKVITKLNADGRNIKPFNFNFFKHKKRSVYNKTIKKNKTITEPIKKKNTTFEKSDL